MGRFVFVCSVVLNAGLLGLLVTAVLVLGVDLPGRPGPSGASGISTVRAQIASTPRFAVDPSWPQFPAGWILGEVSAVALDDRDHAWILHRPRSVSDARASAGEVPLAVVELDVVEVVLVELELIEVQLV